MPYRIDNIDPRTTMMIVVDMQNDFVAEGAKLQSAQAHAMVPKLAATLRFCRRRASALSTRHMSGVAATAPIWDYTTIFIRWSRIARCWSMDRRGPRSTKTWPRRRASTSSKNTRYSAFFATDLDLILREWGVKTVIISGTTTENCCHATARDAMFRNYQVAFLSDATGTFDYPDVGQGALPAADVHRATLTILAFSTADVMTVDEFKARVVGANVAAANKAA